MYSLAAHFTHMKQTQSCPPRPLPLPFPNGQAIGLWLLLALLAISSPLALSGLGTLARPGSLLGSKCRRLGRHILEPFQMAFVGLLSLLFRQGYAVKEHKACVKVR